MSNPARLKGVDIRRVGDVMWFDENTGEKVGNGPETLPDSFPDSPFPLSRRLLKDVNVLMCAGRDLEERRAPAPESESR
jgi:hypothetical protein